MAVTRPHELQGAVADEPFDNQPGHLLLKEKFFKQAARPISEQTKEHSSQWATICSMAVKTDFKTVTRRR